MRSLALFAIATALTLGLAGCDAFFYVNPPTQAVTLSPKLAVKRMTLANGLVVLLHPDASASQVRVDVRYDVGSKDDPEGHYGLAHLYEHLMFLGSPHAKPRDFSEWIEGLGGHFNAGTGKDTTDYYEEVAPGDLPTALWLEADRMAYRLRAVDDAAFARERDVVMNESRENHQNVSYGDVWSLSLAAVFGKHPYGHPPIGTLDDLRRTTLADARAFGATYYRPNNATLVVCGSFDLAVAERLVTTYFATIPPGPALVARSVPAVRLAHDRRVELAAAVASPMVVVAWPAPPRESPGYLALAVTMARLDELARWDLVKKRKEVRAAAAGLDGGRLASLAYVAVKLAPGTDVDDALSSIDVLVQNTARARNWHAFGEHKSRMLVRRVAELESLGERAGALLHGLEYHGQPDSLQADLHAIDALEFSDVLDADEQFLEDARRVVVVVRPDPSAPRAGRSGS